LNQGCEVIIAAEGPQRALLELEFPTLRFIHLKGYRVKYGRKKWSTWLALILQVPKILISIKRERRWLKYFLQHETLDVLISDNRYGLHHDSLETVFMTHQLYIKTHLGTRAERLLQRVNYRYIQRFSTCWVPDFEEGGGLGGILSHPIRLPAMPIRYLGPLTRFTPAGRSVNHQILVLLSGPEPQRTLFENLLLAELLDHPNKVLFIRGLPGDNRMPADRPEIRFHNHLPAIEMNEALNESEYLISRSGYSSIMDLVFLGKKTIMVPTPGQPEQEYLASYLSDKQIIFKANQEGFSLQTCLDAADHFSYLPQTGAGSENLKSQIAAFLAPFRTGTLY
jgi:hypothetical protein